MEETNAYVDQETVLCPGCEEDVEIDHTAGPTFRCPYCNIEFMLEGTILTDDGDLERREQERLRADELDGVRIRKLAAERRAAFRQRSFVIAGLGGCFIFTIQLTWKTYDFVTRLGWQPRPIGFLMFAIACFITGVWLTKIALRQTRELNAHTASVAAATADCKPDFTGLSDGADRWQHLNEVK